MRLVWLVLAWAAAMAAAGPFDLAVSRAASGLTPELADLVRRYGEVPGWVALFAGLVLLATRWWRLGAATVALALIHPLVITQTLKARWGRVRYRDIADMTDYTPFWVAAGPGAGESFPSGHVAMSTVVLPLAVYAWRRGHRWALALALTYVGVVAWGRMAAGAHFLTDCVFSVGLGVVLATTLPTGPREGGLER